MHPESRGPGAWLDYGNFMIAALAWTIAGLLAWSADGLTSRKPDGARRAGMVGAALICLRPLHLGLGLRG